jgi:hypothetical protein
MKFAPASVVGHAFGYTKLFGSSDFWNEGDWRYVANYPVFNIARAWSDQLLRTLDSPKAAAAAKAATTRTILINLRNALAHGGIAYLDKHGRQSVGEAVMFAFVSFEVSKNKPIGLNIIRVGEDPFLSFLETWTSWLQSSGLAYAISEDAYSQG